VRVFKWMRSPHGNTVLGSGTPVVGFQGIGITPFEKSYLISQTYVTSAEEKLAWFSYIYGNLISLMIIFVEDIPRALSP